MWSVKKRGWKDAYHGGNPFARMHRSMPYYTLLRRFTSAAPNVNALDVPTLDGLTGRYYLRIIRIRSRKIRDPFEMVVDCMVRVEPRAVWSKTG